MRDFDEICGYAAEYESSIMKDILYHPPCLAGWIVDVYNLHDRFYTTATVVGVKYVERDFYWAVDIDILTKSGIEIMKLDASRFKLVRNTRPKLRSVK